PPPVSGASTGFSFCSRENVVKHTSYSQRLAVCTPASAGARKERNMISAIVGGLLALATVGAGAFLAALGIFL
ncbi:hypothetical protein, partial [Nocardia brasiliensis]|uniref:hypothetical protein n=1 Tax=Nocardia brasiliensis TaxID=37326 RepID=UPI002454DF6C